MLLFGELLSDFGQVIMKGAEITNKHMSWVQYYA